MARLLTVMLLVSACTASDHYRSRIAPPAERITVFVPGYEGTFLYENGRPVWVTPGEVLRSTGRSLGSCAAGPLPLEPGGPVTRFTAWPYVVDVYGGFMQWAERELPGF